jgi:hypothetical protein
MFWTGLLTVIVGAVFVLWSGWTLQRVGSAPQEKTTTKQGNTTLTVTPQLDRFPSRPVLWLLLIGQTAAIAAGGLLMHAAASMARLEDYSFVRRWLVLAKLPISPVWVMGLPLSLRCQAVLSRSEIREAFDRPDDRPATDGESAFQRPGLFTVPWSALDIAMAVVALAGAFSPFLPWLRTSLAGLETLLPGYDGGYGIAAGLSFLPEFLCVFLSQLQQIAGRWRTAACAAAALSAIAASGMFL